MKILHVKSLAAKTSKAIRGSVLFSALLCLLSCSPPPAVPRYGPPMPASIDRILDKLGLANIAFNAPTTLRLGERAGIQLLLSTQESVEELQQKIIEAGQKEGAEIHISDQMQARLTGFGFAIQAVTPETQAVSDKSTTEWKWDIKPTESGPQRLHLTVSALLSIEGSRVPRAIRTFDRMIDVRVTWQERLSLFFTENWQWLWTAILIPIVGWLWKRRKKRGAEGVADDT